MNLFQVVNIKLLVNKAGMLLVNPVLNIQVVSIQVVNGMLVNKVPNGKDNPNGKLLLNLVLLDIKVVNGKVLDNNNKE